MADLLDTIKKIVIKTMENSKPVALSYGAVESINPLTVRIDQKLLLGRQFLILTENVMDKTVNGITISNGLKTGDKLIMLRVEEGQKYLVLSKVV